MGIKADEMNINIEGSYAEIKKIMGSWTAENSPIIIVINIPISADEKTKKYS